MSRSRPVDLFWFDKHQYNDPATPAQLIRLAELRDEDLDELLEEGLTQKQVMESLRVQEGTLRRPDEFVVKGPREPEVCRICGPRGWECEGSSSKHHFIPRWMMKLLDNYLAYAPRGVCTIPICLGRHRDLHLRGDQRTPKSMAGLLTPHEEEFASKLLAEFREERPKVFEILLAGDDTAYEHTLVMDFITGKFRS